MERRLRTDAGDRFSAVEPALGIFTSSAAGVRSQIEHQTPEGRRQAEEAYV
jgi:hypothetical protein